MHLPQQRKLSGDIYQETKNMLNVKGNKTMIQRHIYRNTGKIVTLKNLHNLGSDLDGHLIDINEVLDDPSQLSLNLLDENVNWKLTQKYFKKGAWNKVTDLITHLSKEPEWKCGTCQKTI